MKHKRKMRSLPLNLLKEVLGGKEARMLLKKVKEAKRLKEKKGGARDGYPTLKNRPISATIRAQAKQIMKSGGVANYCTLHYPKARVAGPLYNKLLGIVRSVALHEFYKKHGLRGFRRHVFSDEARRKSVLVRSAYNPVLCPHCGKEFQNQSSLKTHRAALRRKGISFGAIAEPVKVEVKSGDVFVPPVPLEAFPR